MMKLNEDQPYRVYRLIEALSERDLKRSRKNWSLVDGWLELAEDREPRSPKALLEGDYVVRLPDGSVFKEVTFKTEHESVGMALPDWAAGVGRRWARYRQGVLEISDGATLALADIEVEEV